MYLSNRKFLNHVIVANVSSISWSSYSYNINFSVASVGKSYQESYYSIQGSGLGKMKHCLLQELV